MNIRYQCLKTIFNSIYNPEFPTSILKFLIVCQVISGKCTSRLTNKNRYWDKACFFEVFPQ